MKRKYAIALATCLLASACASSPTSRKPAGDSLTTYKLRDTTDHTNPQTITITEYKSQVLVKYTISGGALLNSGSADCAEGYSPPKKVEKTDKYFSYGNDLVSGQNPYCGELQFDDNSKFPTSELVVPQQGGVQLFYDLQ